MTDRNARPAPWIAAAVLLALVGGYVGTYFATVEPLWDGAVVTYPRLHGLITTSAAERSWLLWKKFFSPIHWVDRRLRPDVWASNIGE